MTTELNDRAGLRHVGSDKKLSCLHEARILDFNRDHQMAAESTSAADWCGRYYHIDQVLNTPGPRTDPAFLAGDGVCDIFCLGIAIIILTLVSR